MARVFVTGSADGLGREAAQSLLDDGHEVVVHARSEARLAAVSELVDRGAARRRRPGPPPAREGRRCTPPLPAR